AVRRDLEARACAAAAARVHRQYEDLRAEPLGDLRDQRGSRHSAGAHAHLVRTGAQQPVHIVDAADAAADGERDEDLLGCPGHHAVRRRAVLCGGRDVKEHQLVRTLGVVGPGQLDGIAGGPQPGEPNPLDDPAGVDVQAWDHPDRYTHRPTPGRYATASTSTSIRGSISPLTSTIEVAGMVWPNASPCARPYSSHREMSVTNILVQPSSANDAPP